MNDMIAWIAAEAERPEVGGEPELPSSARPGKDVAKFGVPASGLVAHQFPVRVESAGGSAQSPASAFLTSTFPTSAPAESLMAVESAEEVEDRVFDEDRERRVYRGRTVAMLRRYMRYSIETGRLPSLLGGEIFRAKVTTYTVVTFEDRVIFVHDMEKCLGRLDEFSRQLIARHVLQEHDPVATAKLLHCNEKTVRRYTPVVLDLLSQILIEVGLLNRLESVRENSCQEGESTSIDVSSCEDGKYKV